MDPLPMRTLFLLATVAIASVAHSQRLFDVGLKAGASLDDLRSSYRHEALVGGHIGAFVRLKPPILPGVQGEALLSTMGTRLHIEGNSVDLRSATLQLPLFLIFSLGPVELHAGGYYDKQLAKSIDATVQLEEGSGEVQLEDLNDGGFGLLAGAGLHLGSFYAAARYNYGLDAIGRGPYLDDVRTEQIQLSIGWGFVK